MELILDSKTENTSTQPNFQKIDKIATEAKIADAGASFMEPGTKAKAKKGRPTKEEAAKRSKEQKESALGNTAQASSQAQPQQSAPMGIPSKEIAKPVAGFISNMGVSYVGDPRAGMTPDELEMMATAMGMVMDKYLPTVMGQYGAEAMLILSLGQYGVRIMAMKKYLDQEKQEKAQRFTEQPKPQSAEAPVKPDDFAHHFPVVN